MWRGDKVAWNMHLPQQQYQDDNGFSDASGPYDSAPGTPPDAMSWFSRTDRPTCEIKEIASITGNTVTFTTPLHIDYRKSHTAQLTGYSGANAFVKNAGVESLTAIGGADGQIRFENAAYSWAKNIENTQWLGEGFAVNGSFRVEIRESFIHDGSWPEPGGAGYAISFAGGSSDVLVENNIILNACKVVVVRSCGAGSVFGYNYTDDSWDFDNPAWVEVGLNASHMAGPHHVLFEGNYSPNLDSDYTHGNAIDLTFFRNWLSGQRRSFTDTANVRAVGLAYGSWWDSVIGNVLGRPGQMSGWLYEDPAMTGNNSNWGGSAVWRLGYDPERWSMVPDPETLSTVIRDGNYDYLTNSVHWHKTPGGYALPSSLYLPGKPAFFGSATWPWVDATRFHEALHAPRQGPVRRRDPVCASPGRPAATPARLRRDEVLDAHALPPRRHAQCDGTSRGTADRGRRPALVRCDGRLRRPRRGRRGFREPHDRKSRGGGGPRRLPERHAVRSLGLDDQHAGGPHAREQLARLPRLGRQLPRQEQRAGRARLRHRRQRLLPLTRPPAA